MTLEWTQGELAGGLRCYRGRKFFMGWESVCLVTIGPPKTLLQALIQPTAALSLRHVPLGNSQGASSLIETPLHRLELHLGFFSGGIGSGIALRRN